MSNLDSLILGIIQGITEFLPVSSSGHLILMRFFLGLTEIPVLYDVILHISTLAVIILVFRRKIGAILRSITSWIRASSSPADRENLKLCLLIILATIITAALGLLLVGLEEIILKRPKIISLLFLVTALILIATRFMKGDLGYLKLGILGAGLIGFAQGLGVLPGISRSGITISAALLYGLEREKAGEFSFLIAIPAILGALVLKLNEAGALISRVDPLALSLGIASSFGVGLLSLLLLLKLVRRGRLYYFSFYLVPLGLLGLILF